MNNLPPSLPMSDDLSAPEAQSFSPRMYGIVLLVLAIIITGIFFISKFTQMDLNRDLQTWQEKLNLIAESRSKEVKSWVDNQFTELHKLSDNPALQLYLSELQTMSPDAAGRTSEEPAQKTYLRNLLIFTAERAGYANSGVSSAQMRANVGESNDSGLAVLDKDQRIVVSSATSSEITDLIKQYAASSPAGRDYFIDITMRGNALKIGFSVPVFSIQGERNANAQIGRVIGIKIVDSSFFSLLKHPGVTEQTLETILARRNESKIELVSPLMDGTSPLAKQLDFANERSAESALIQTIGSFSSERNDYRNRKVLATSRNIANTPWVLMVKVDRQEALTKSDQRRASMIIFFFFLIATIVLIIFAVWWHAHSKRAMMMSYHFKKIASQAKAQAGLLRLVADHQPEPIFILDRQHRIQFANEQTALTANMLLESMIGKSIRDVRGTARTEKLIAQCDKAAQENKTTYAITQAIDAGDERIIRAAFVPLSHIPIASLPEPTPGVLIVEQDISEVVREREHRIQIHNQLIETLIRLVDKRDPYAADHSMLVAHIACEIAMEMNLDNLTAETARIAGSLMNLGKIIVPHDLLTKTDALSDAERQVIQDSMYMAADLVKTIQFEGPVVETLRQWQERWDGSGPLGMSGESIIISARIIAAANAFIGMISPRSWRNAIAISAANKFLLEQSDALFDRRVVVALINYVENRDGITWINKILEEKKKMV